MHFTPKARYYSTDNNQCVKKTLWDQYKEDAWKNTYKWSTKPETFLAIMGRIVVGGVGYGIGYYQGIQAQKEQERTEGIKKIKELVKDKLSPNNMLRKTRDINAVYLKEAEDIMNKEVIKLHYSSKNVTPEELKEYLYLKYSLANKYMDLHDGKKAKQVFEGIKSELEDYIKREGKDIERLKKDGSCAVIQEFSNTDFQVMYIRVTYSLGRTYLYNKNNEDWISMEEALGYFRSIEQMSAKIGKSNLFEVHLSKSNGIGIIMREDAERLIKDGYSDKAKDQLIQVLGLYNERKNDIQEYIRDYNTGVGKLITPGIDPRCLADMAEQKGRCYLDLMQLAKTEEEKKGYIYKAILGITGGKYNREQYQGVDVATIYIQEHRKIATLLNVLGNVILEGYRQKVITEKKNINKEVMAWLKKEKYFEELLKLKFKDIPDIPEKLSVLNIIRLLSDISKDISRQSDFTKADACQLAQKVIKTEIEELKLESNVDEAQVLKLQTLQEENEKEEIRINEEIGRKTLANGMRYEVSDNTSSNEDLDIMLEVRIKQELLVEVQKELVVKKTVIYIDGKIGEITKKIMQEGNTKYVVLPYIERTKEERVGHA